MEGQTEVEVQIVVKMDDWESNSFSNPVVEIAQNARVMIVSNYTSVQSAPNLVGLQRQP